MVIIKMFLRSGGEYVPFIRVSFKENDDEIELYNRIKEVSKFVGDSGWMKQAAAEKLGFDKKEEYIQKRRRSLGDIQL